MKLPCIVYSGELEFATVRVLIVRDEEDHTPKVVVEREGTDRLGTPRWVDADDVTARAAIEAAVVAMALTIDTQNGESGEIES